MRRLETIESRWAAAADRVWRGTPPPVYLWPLLLTGRDPVMPAGAAKTPVVEVRVNWSVWQTMCPFCSSAQHAALSERWFYCAQCMNAENGHLTLPVKWPRDPSAVEAQLARRAFPAERNWEPGQTTRDLKREDEEANQ